jgi:hypothetical protein|tara:strand:+ start:95 stop:331 length:237 start_codon:yes stop_codon:yes gene_type:complete
MIKLKDILKEDYTPSRNDSIEDVFKSAVESLEDLANLFQENAPQERLLIKTLDKQAKLVRTMITKNKSYNKIKKVKHY